MLITDDSKFLVSLDVFSALRAVEHPYFCHLSRIQFQLIAAATCPVGLIKLAKNARRSIKSDLEDRAD